MNHHSMNRKARVTGLFLAAACHAGFAIGQTTERVSVDGSHPPGQGNGGSNHSSISADGFFVAFDSWSSNLVPGGTNGFNHVFVRDRANGTTELISVDSNEVQGNSNSAGYSGPAISADARFVAFSSEATNLVASDTNGFMDIFVRDRLNGTTELVSVGPGGVQGNGTSGSCGFAISADGRFVAFNSDATNLVAGGTNGHPHVFVWDRQNGTTELVSVSSAGVQGNNISGWRNTAISGDGRFVAFGSAATNLVTPDTNGTWDIFVRDRLNGTTEFVTVGPGGVQANVGTERCAISTDGRYVTFSSGATNLVVGDANGAGDVFRRDLPTRTNELVSVDSLGTQGNGGCDWSSVSTDGRFVAFESSATNLVSSDNNGVFDVFVHDFQSGTTARVSVDSGGAEGNGASGFYSTPVAISANGRCVTFLSGATNLVTGDTNGFDDIFVHDLWPPSPGTDLCQPGVGVVLACPCSNPPASAPRGCDNSSGTGGAQLTSSGVPSLSSDTLVFVTNGERPTATSILLQGTLEVTGGVAFGQGVRCAGGALKRLYVKAASGGSITAPSPGDPSVSARAAALNQPIAPGASRWYAVYYRDPIVLGGCSAASTFNITQTQLVNWGS